MNVTRPHAEDPAIARADQADPGVEYVAVTIYRDQGHLEHAVPARGQTRSFDIDNAEACGRQGRTVDRVEGHEAHPTRGVSQRRGDRPFRPHVHFVGLARHLIEERLLVEVVAPQHDFAVTDDEQASHRNLEPLVTEVETVEPLVHDDATLEIARIDLM